MTRQFGEEQSREYITRGICDNKYRFVINHNNIGVKSVTITPDQKEILTTVISTTK